MNRINQKNDTNIDLVFLLYWGVLVLWQSVNPGGAGSFADTAIKSLLILFLVGYYFFHISTFSGGAAVLAVLFGLNMALAFSSEPSVTLRTVLTYFFPVAFVFLSCCTGGGFHITRRKLLRFMRAIILIVLYMAVYALIDTPEKFFGALSVSGAYGNELSSFLISNFEYGIYLMAGITACIVCVELDSKKGRLISLFYTGALCLFLVNLILTYSRTSILITLVIIFSYALLNRKSRFAKGVLLVCFLGCFLIFSVAELRRFFFETVFKGNNLAGRDTLASLAVEVFRSGSLREKLWGQGATPMAGLFREETDHASVHNGYLQILLYFGIVPLCFLVLFLLVHLATAGLFVKRNLFIGVLSIGLLLACALAMVSTTACLFASSIDSFFLTMFTVLVPKYVRNAIRDGVFDG